MRGTCGVRVSYVSPPPAWMPGKEALDHIRETDGCSASDAIKQLRSAISDGRANARLPNSKSLVARPFSRLGVINPSPTIPAWRRRRYLQEHGKFQIGTIGATQKFLQTALLDSLVAGPRDTHSKCDGGTLCKFGPRSWHRHYARARVRERSPSAMEYAKRSQSCGQPAIRA